MLKLAWKYMRYYKNQTLAIFAGIVLTASLLSGIGSLIYSSQKSDLENSRTVYGDWHYYVETDGETFQAVRSKEQGEGYSLEKCGKMEIRDVVAEPFLICFIYADETYREMARRDLLRGTFPERENEIAADEYVLGNLGFSGDCGDPVQIGGQEYIVTGIVKSEWAANTDEMEVFVGDSFKGRGSRTFLYLKFDENEKLYRQLDAFLKEHRISSDAVEGNDEVTRYLGGEEPDRIYDIIKFGLTEEEGNLTYIILKLQSDYNLTYNGMIFFLCLFSLFVIYSVFNISVSKRTAEYGILQTLGISEAQITGTLITELWILFLIGYPAGCLAGNGILSLVYGKFSAVFGAKGIVAAMGTAAGTAAGMTGQELSGADQTLAESGGTVQFYVSWEAMAAGFVFLLVFLACIACLVVRSMRKRTLRDVMSGDTSFIKRRKIYALRPVNMAGVVVRKFMFFPKKKMVGILLSLSVGGCVFLCTTYMVENLKIHAELSLKSDDGLGSEYRISLKSTSLDDTIPAETAEEIKSMPGTENVYATKYTLGEIQLSEQEFLSDEAWKEYFDYQNQDPYFISRYDGICNRQEDGSYRIKYDVYGYDEELLGQLDDFILEGEIDPEEIKAGNKVVAVANMDGQGNYYFYGKKPGDTITLRVPKAGGDTDALLKFQGNEDEYIEKEFEIAAVVSRSLAQEKGFLNTEVWTNAQSVIMTNVQMEEEFGITDYSFINASPSVRSEADAVSGRLLRAIRDIPKAVLQDYTSAIETKKDYLEQQQIFFSSIAVLLLVISLFHIMNSMNHSVLARRREFGIMRAMGITDSGFYRMILQTGILYGVLTDALIFLVFHLFLRRAMDYYMAHVLQFLHIQEGIPGTVFAGVMSLNIAIAVLAVMLPARKLAGESIIKEVTG